MISPLLLWLAGLVAQVIAPFTRPTVARCPAGTALLDGVRPSGESACVSTFDPRPESTAARYAHRDAPSVPIRVWCDEGQIGVVINERIAGCGRDARE